MCPHYYCKGVKVVIDIKIYGLNSQGFRVKDRDLQCLDLREQETWIIMAVSKQSAE